jgi:hypothetical protein
MNLDDIQRQIDQVVQAQNHQGKPEFEGYSPFEMHQILNFTFGSNSPVKLQTLTDADYNKIPILNLVKYLTRLIHEAGEMKLTNKGYLPTKIVSELYQQGFLKEEHIESKITKLYKETDSLTINLARILTELSGLAKKRNGKLSLTKSGEKIISDNDKLLKAILGTFTTKFNWAYYDGYGENQIGQMGFGFSLILLSKYGQERRLDTFYSKKYFEAFPRLLDSIEPTFGTLEYYTTNCYSLRTFDRFMNYFGLTAMNKEGKGFDAKKYITKTELLDKLITCTPHNNRP